VEFNYNYASDSAVTGDTSQTSMSFAPDTLRQPTFFTGELKQSLEFREAMSALHDVVVSDMRYQPKDRTAYLEWARQNEEVDLAKLAGTRANVVSQLAEVQQELAELRRRHAQRMGPFVRAQRRYYDWLYKANYNWWLVLDPVITVHPDEVFFECFSQDESSYGRLGVDYNVFQNIGEFECGTTNIDYSAELYDEFQKIRSYKTTRFEIDPSGFEVQTTAEETYKEVKIDLPDSWVRGFLQVSSAMALPAVQFDLHPMDVHNLCFVLRRRKEKSGPRSLRYILKPGYPVKIVVDPWGIELECLRSQYNGSFEGEIRVWGRRRLHILERLIPVARRFTVQLLGKGMPSFYVADLGDMSFTLGLSGWTSNDWSGAGNFDLLAPRAEVDQVTKERVFAELKRNWLATPEQLAAALNLDRSIVLGALAAYTQAGSAMWDMNKGVYRARELSRQPLPLDSLRFNNEREQQAMVLLGENNVAVEARLTSRPGVVQLNGALVENRQRYKVSITVDADERVLDATCNCNWHQQNQLRQGPCQHILAVRLQYNRETAPNTAGANRQPT